MEGEISNFTKVWLTVFVSLGYCYVIGKAISKGPLRLLFLLPIVCLFLYLPLKLSSLNLIGLTGFFISWLGNFKLLLFAFGKGPLASDHSNFSLKRFVAVTCLPLNISHKNEQNKETPSPKAPEKGQISLLIYAIKGLLLAVLLKVSNYKEFIHPKVLLGLYCIHIYISLELTLAIAAAMAKAVVGLKLEPQFNEPYLSSSLQDFWGRRWNLTVSSILRATVYEPTLNFSKHVIGPKWAPVPAVMATFLVSALMHEILFYHLGRLRPTWRVTGFFLLHGFCLAVEVVLKKAIGKKWRLPRPVSGTLTIVFVISTSLWLFIPQFLRFQADVRLHEEFAALGAFIEHVTHSFLY